jgi:hypothetical protein
MVYKEVDNTGKNRAIGAVILKYLPDNCRSHIAYLLDDDLGVSGINIEAYTEMAMAECGQMQQVNGHGYDFIRIINGKVHQPDSKTASAESTPRNSGNYPGAIKSVTRSSGSQKAGDLLTVIYIPFTESAKFFYIPKAWWINNVTDSGRLNFMYNPKTNSIDRFEEFECKTFEDLCSPDRIGEWERRKAKLAKLWSALLEAETDEDKDVARAAYIKEVKVA